MAKCGTREWSEEIWAAGTAGQLPTWACLTWYGVDSHGRVGLFTNGGIGPIPKAVFRDLDTYDFLSQIFSKLPKIGKSEILMEYHSTKFWKKAAERGLFAFDYDDGKKRPNGYRLVARPTLILQLDSLSPWVQTQLSYACLRNESFSDVTERIIDLSGIRCGLIR